MLYNVGILFSKQFLFRHSSPANKEMNAINLQLSRWSFQIYFLSWKNLQSYIFIFEKLCYAPPPGTIFSMILKTCLHCCLKLAPVNFAYFPKHMSHICINHVFVHIRCHRVCSTCQVIVFYSNSSVSILEVWNK